jgi:hypothetical protein
LPGARPGKARFMSAVYHGLRRAVIRLVFRRHFLGQFGPNLGPSAPDRLLTAALRLAK